MKALLAQILADTQIDQSEVAQLSAAINADGAVSRVEADLLFDLNRKATVKCAEWPGFFAKTVADHLLADGKLDEAETTYLNDKILADGTIDDAEKALLSELAARGANLPASLTSLM